MKQLIFQEQIRELDSLDFGEKVFIIANKIRTVTTFVEVSRNALLMDTGKKFPIKTGNSFKKYSYGSDYLIIPKREPLIIIENKNQ